jgi:peptide-methionine (S)-S-oxide reductase
VAAAKEVATLGGGCFWCLEAVYEQVTGVGKVVSGYAGGQVPDPSYEDVCTGETGHAEVVQVTFDPKAITYREVLEIFFTIHDPTTPNRQGQDVGTQYRSVVFTHSPEQKKAAEEVVREFGAKRVWKDPIVTRIEPLERFYAAEDYHQHYFARNPQNPYCRVVIDPKVAKFRKQWASKLRSAPTST